MIACNKSTNMQVDFWSKITSKFQTNIHGASVDQVKKSRFIYIHSGWYSLEIGKL